MKEVLKKLINDRVLSFSSLVLKYYHRFDLTEREAIALIKLHKLLEEGERIIKPQQFSKWLATSPKETEAILNSLINKGYLSIRLDEDEKGKQCETFDVDFILNKISNHIQKTEDEKQDNVFASIVDYLESMFQKPLTQMEMEIVQDWLQNETYSEPMIKAAVKKVITFNNPSIKHVDHILINQLKDTKKQPKKNVDALKEFHKLWEE